MDRILFLSIEILCLGKELFLDFSPRISLSFRGIFSILFFVGRWSKKRLEKRWVEAGKKKETDLILKLPQSYAEGLTLLSLSPLHSGFMWNLSLLFFERQGKRGMRNVLERKQQVIWKGRKKEAAKVRGWMKERWTWKSRKRCQNDSVSRCLILPFLSNLRLEVEVNHSFLVCIKLCDLGSETRWKIGF